MMHLPLQATYDGWTPLMAGMDGSKYGNVEILKLLLSHSKIHVNLVNFFGKTALILASLNGFVELVKVLLQCSATDIGIKDRNGWTALDWAKEKADKDIGQYWKQKYEDIVDIIEHRSDLLKKENSTCPHAKYSVGSNDSLAVSVPYDCTNDFVDFLTFDGQLDELESILLQCPELDSEVINSRPIYGDTALIRAVHESKPKLVKMLLDQPNIDPNKEGGSFYEPPLINAVVYENTELVQLLLDDTRYAFIIY